MLSRILIVDDEQGIREQLSRWLYHEGYKTEQAANAKEALALVRKINFTVILLDLKLPDMNGIEVLEQLHKDYPDICVIVLTGHGQSDSPAKAREAGAFDFFTKPIQYSSLIDRIDTAINQFRKARENYYQREEEKQQFQFETVIGKSEAMQQVFDLIQKVAKSEETILIRGETGTGKDLLARATHYNSARKDNPFILADCSALAENLAESELFGHEKGAFTGANFRKIGKFERANGGTLFVNEVGVLSPNLQLKFLQFLQDGTFERLGGGEPIHVDARIIAATNVNLEEAVAMKNFRQDLYSRLNRVLINVPPLKKRRDDIPLLTRHFIKKFNRRNAKNITDISLPALELLENYHFPENVRELENIIASAILLEDGEVIKPETIRMRLVQPATNPPAEYRNLDYRAAKQIFEKTYFTQLLEQTDGNISQAAKLADLDRTHLRNKMKELGMYSGGDHDTSDRKSLKVFISYSHVDSLVADSIENALRQRKLEVFRDKTNLRAGHRWPKEIEKHLEACNTLVLLWSMHSAGSDWVDKERTYSMLEKKRIIIIQLDKTPIPPLLSNVHAMLHTDVETTVREIERGLGIEPASSE